MTPMFSAYVVVPAPPNAPASVVAAPSPMNARPRSLSRSAPVISETALTCPAFSAIRTMTTGRNSSRALNEKLGEVKSGSPIQSASPRVRTLPSGVVVCQVIRSMRGSPSAV